MRKTDWLFISGTVLFVAGAAGVVRSLGHHAGGLRLIGLGAIVASVVCFGVGGWRIHRDIDWQRVETEQRLWESGALGRAWLKIRQALLRR